MRPAFLHSISDLTSSEIHALLERARQLERQPPPRRRRFSVGLLFLVPSLRTRVGFASATARLGGSPIEVTSLRVDDAMSQPERLADTIRVFSGMVDALIVRTADPLARQELESVIVCGYVNGGDAHEHPTQALVDLYGIERDGRSVEELCVGVCGNLESRCSRSLRDLFERRPPMQLVLVGPGMGGWTDLAGVDVLYMAGLPERVGGRTVGARERSRYALTAERLHDLSPDVQVLAPMPVVDEIAADVRDDPRIRMFEQSDNGVFVRMAIIEACLEGSPGLIG